MPSRVDFPPLGRSRSLCPAPSCRTSCQEGWEGGSLGTKLGLLTGPLHITTTSPRTQSTARHPRSSPKLDDQVPPAHAPQSLSPFTMSTLKGPTPQQHEGSGLRIGIVHARWNETIIEPLVKGAKDKLLACGVKESNIVIQSVPGAWELPIGVQRYGASSPHSIAMSHKPSC